MTDNETAPFTVKIHEVDTIVQAQNFRFMLQGTFSNLKKR